MKSRNLFLFLVVSLTLIPITQYVFASTQYGVVEVKSGGGLFGIITGLFSPHKSMSSENSVNTGSNSINSQSGILRANITNAKSILDNGNLACDVIASRLGGISIPNGKVCDVVIARQNPHNMLNNFLEFQLSNSTSGINHQVFVRGDFALFEKEMNAVQSVAKNNGWNVTGTHIPVASNTPTITLMYWEVQNDVDKVITQVNQALAHTSIKG